MESEMDTAKVLKVIDGIITEPAFMTTCKDFVNKHCETFEDDLENKLEYTTLHEEYMNTVESHIEDGIVNALGPDFDMAGFMDALPAYLKKESQKADGVAETIDFLHGFGEFENFKDMMLVAKRDKQSSDSGLAHVIQGTSFSPDQEKVIAEAQEFCKELVDTSDADHWTTVIDKPWVKVERRAKPGSPEFVRISVTVDMEVSAAADMVGNYTKERNQWDDFMTDCEIVEEVHGTDDAIVKMTFRIPLTRAQTKHSRVLTTRDYPEKGGMSYMYLDWDPITKSLAPAKTSIGNGFVMADPKDPKKTIYTSTHMMSNSFIPSFLVHWMLATFMPRTLTKNALRYKKYKGLA
eukprot:CAMPEP_0117680280 /NCGR_PEP_ID=MMETSP0804-20121206/18265_1 /TAXON_ID=1074897 /ORGANISM="Tetraselmis astigmatica, Strain CCMP880" /LENGTH=349 /DNA_ID=CAMNT_0005489761 /DNA_START=77 /DNA_END=1126 /DNA_ORIENTATION=+